MPASTQDESRLALLGWPDYGFRWSEASGMATVGFRDVTGNLESRITGLVYTVVARPAHPIFCEPAANATTVLINLTIARTGNLSSAYTVAMNRVSTEGDGSAIRFVVPAAFTAGESRANVTIAVDRAYVEYPGEGQSGENYDCIEFTIGPSPEYEVATDDSNHFILFINFNAG